METARQFSRLFVPNAVQREERPGLEACVRQRPKTEPCQFGNDAEILFLGTAKLRRVSFNPLPFFRHGSMAYQIAELYADRGESDKAVERLNRACEQRDPGLGS